MRCKICKRSVRASVTKGKHSWETNQQCSLCHHLGVKSHWLYKDKSRKDNT